MQSLSLPPSLSPSLPPSLPSSISLSRSQVLLDEFITSVTQEKEELEKQKQKLKEEEDMAHRVTGVLDPFVENLAQFNGNGDLTAKIARSYVTLDEDGSGGLSFDEFESAMSKNLLKTETEIKLLIDDFHILTEDGKLLDEEGEFSDVQFQKMMRGELKRYSQRRVQNAMSETNSKEFRAVLLAIKLLDLTQEKHEGMLCKIMKKLGIVEEEEEEEEGGEGGEEGQEGAGEQEEAASVQAAVGGSVSPQSQWAHNVDQRLASHVAHVDAKLDALAAKLDRAFSREGSDDGKSGGRSGVGVGVGVGVGGSNAGVAELNDRLDAIAALLAGACACSSSRWLLPALA